LVLEVGAHEARFSRRAAEALPEATVIAFEANPFVHAKFAQSMPSRVDYRLSAVGRNDQPISLSIPLSRPSPDGTVPMSPANTTSSLLARREEGYAYEAVQCECTSVDLLLEGMANDQTVALWVDVEGASQEVLAGASSALAEAVALIYIEVEDHAAWQGQWLAEDVTAHLEANGYVALARDRETSWQYNWIFVRRDLELKRFRPSLLWYLDTLHAAVDPSPPVVA
jgi:FkbM family methyltransferase